MFRSSWTSLEPGLQPPEAHSPPLPHISGATSKEKAPVHSQEVPEATLGVGRGCPGVSVGGLPLGLGGAGVSLPLPLAMESQAALCLSQHPHPWVRPLMSQIGRGGAHKFPPASLKPGAVLWPPHGTTGIFECIRGLGRRGPWVGGLPLGMCLGASGGA